MFWSSHAKTCTEKLTYVCKELISATKDVKLELVLFPFHFWIWYETPSSIYQVYLDGVLQQLPELEGLVVLNINSWSAGCCVWNDHSTSDHFGASRWEMGREGGRWGGLHT